MKFFLFLIVMLLISYKKTVSQEINIYPTTKLNKLDSVASQDVPARAPGIATVIVEDSQIAFLKYAGYADLTDSVLININTRFNMASVGKQFTALAILTLIDNNKLNLDDDIRMFFPRLFPKVKEKITLQNLLSHTSGIRDCYDLWSLQGLTWWKNSFNNNDVLILLEKQEDLNFRPNSKYLYSNSNYILLALIIEKVSGRTFVEYTNDMFGKLNMPNTSFENDYTKIRGPIARAYFNFNTWTSFNWIWNVCGDGNLFSTLADQVQWEKLIQGKGKSGIKQAIILQSQQPIEDSSFKNYGYGLEFGTYKDINYSFHEGATGAWKATVLRFPAKNVSMLTMTNTGKSIPSMQTRQMADIVFELDRNERYFVTKPEKTGNHVSEEEIVGTYLTDSDFSFQFEKINGKMFLKRIGRNDVEVEREADNIFHQKFDTLFKQEFVTNSTGELEVTAYYIDHAPYTLTRKTADFSTFDFNSLTGRFINSETNAVIEIKFIGDKSYSVSIARQDTTKGLLISPGKILVNNYSIDIENASQKILVLYLNGDRIKNVKFMRKE